MTSIEKLASENPNQKVRLCFKSMVDGNLGTLETTAAHAANPNQSQRFFPPEGQTASQMGWPVPYFYAEECYKIVKL